MTSTDKASDILVIFRVYFFEPVQIYMLMFLKNERIDKDTIYKLDLQGIS